MPVENVAATVDALAAFAVEAGDLDAFIVLAGIHADALRREEPEDTGHLRRTTTVARAAPNVASVTITAPYARFVRARNDFVARADALIDAQAPEVVSDALDNLIRRYDLE